MSQDIIELEAEGEEIYETEHKQKLTVDNKHKNPQPHSNKILCKKQSFKVWKEYLAAMSDHIS